MKKITLITVGSVCYDLLRFSIDQCVKHTPDVERVVTVTPAPVYPGAEHVQLPENFNRVDYSRFMIKDLVDHVETEYALVFQYDGMAVDHTQWTNDFYNYDYIGAAWPERFSWLRPDQRVGNGGFSLRSRRLLEALQDPDITVDGNEDAKICQQHKRMLESRYNISYATIELADKFSNEWNNPNGAVFGFHGIFNFPLYFDDKTTANLIDKYELNTWYDDQLQKFLEFCQNKNYIESLLTLERKLST